MQLQTDDFITVVSLFFILYYNEFIQGNMTMINGKIVYEDGVTKLLIRKKYIISLLKCWMILEKIIIKIKFNMYY